MSPRKSPKPDRDPEDHICPSLSQISGDGDRLNALYSPFRPRETNPESYDQKLRFWTKVLAEWVNLSGRLTFTLHELQRGLRLKGKSPACLEEVLEHCRRCDIKLYFMIRRIHLMHIRFMLQGGGYHAKVGLC
jgi:hypothetical protein